MKIQLEIEMGFTDKAIIIYEEMEEIARRWLDKCISLTLKVDND